jgi:hypothetical protein
MRVFILFVCNIISKMKKGSCTMRPITRRSTNCWINHLKELEITITLKARSSWVTLSFYADVELAGATTINVPPIGAPRPVAAAKELTLNNAIGVVGLTNF